MSMEAYPKRESQFAFKYLHALDAAEVVSLVGKSASLLIYTVVLCEDRKRYTCGVNFWQSQLMSRIGINCKKQFRQARQRAIDSGLLFYHSNGTRSAGTYWVMVPKWLVGRFSDLNEADSCSASGTQTNESSNGLGGDLPPNHQHTINGLGGDLPPNEQSSERLGGGLGGILPPPPFLIPIPKRKECHDLGSRDASESSTKRKKAFTDADRQTASWMAEQLRQTNPEGRKKSAAELDAWANDIRLIRERDGKSDSEIRSLFSWANRDEFWSSNILSPGKLRKQWDKLTAKRKSSGRGSSSVPPSHQNMRTV
jgi:hypothetical protein